MDRIICVCVCVQLVMHVQDDGRIPLVNIPMSLLRPKPDSLEGQTDAAIQELEKIHGPLDSHLFQAHF